MLQDRRGDAETAMQATLQRWVRDGTTPGATPAAGTLEADVLAIRDAVFRPLGGGLLGKGWNAHDWPSHVPPFLVAPAMLRIKTANHGYRRPGGRRRQPAGFSNVVFLPLDDMTYLTRSVSALGGTARRQPRAVMETPNQPMGEAAEIVEWWSRFFPARPGHWGGFEILSYPAFSVH